jgi:hypothetical protein
MLVKSRITLAAALLALLITPFTQAAAQMAPPFVKKHLYDSSANPKADIAAAIKQARAQKKRVILDFGGDWCGDWVLDIYMHQSQNSELLDRALCRRSSTSAAWTTMSTSLKVQGSINKGVPALAVLLIPQAPLLAGEQGFENMRNMQSSDVTLSSIAGGLIPAVERGCGRELFFISGSLPACETPTRIPRHSASRHAACVNATC